MLVNWFRGLVGRDRPRSPRRAHRPPASRRVRPQIEVLEERAVPAAVRDFTGFRANIMLPTPTPLPPGFPAAQQIFRGGFTDDGSTGPIPLGFTINFFGNVTNSIFINNNGNITLGTPTPVTPGDYNIENGGLPMIAPFFADVDTTRVRSEPVTFGNDFVAGHLAFGIDWINVSYFSATNPIVDKVNVFQLILISRPETGPGNFDIEFNYDSIKWEVGDKDSLPGSLGTTNGLGPRSALAGFSNGAGRFFLLPGSGAPGQLLDGGPFALATHEFLASTPGRYHFLFRNGEFVTSEGTQGLEITGAIRQFNPFRFVRRPDGTYTGRFLFRRVGAAFGTAFANNLGLDEVGTIPINSTGPTITLVFSRLPPGVTPTVITGFTASGAPFLTLPAGALSTPNGLLRVLLSFRNPQHVPLSTYFQGFPIRVFTGPFNPALV